MLSYEWKQNKWATKRKVPDDIRAAGYPKIDIIDEYGCVQEDVNIIMAFIGCGPITHYRLHRQAELPLEYS